MSADRRVWVGCLACYNAGNLVGDWVSPDEGPEWACPAYGPGTRHDPASAWVETHEETWVMDHEGFAGFLKGECSPQNAAELDAKLSEAEEAGYDLSAVSAWLANDSSLSLDDLDQFDEAYCGEWDSEREYASELADDSLGLRRRADEGDYTAIYFDAEQFERDLFMGDYWSAPAAGGGVYVFRA